tara:strand:+ start:635 stop:1306 length:672 start_codon:yes stop_codon:yes gene_type:complete
MNYISYNKTYVKRNNKKYILKKYIIKTIPKHNYKIVNDCILAYHKVLFKNCTGIPKLISNKKELEFKFEYCGKSCAQILQKKNINFNEMNMILDGISKILNICEEKKIDLDPHFKNFTIKNNKVYFVDLYPPMNNKFINILLNYNKNIKKNIKMHLTNYDYKKIKHHFLADLKKSKYINRKFYFYAKKYFLQKRIIKNINYKLINKIIKIEESNLKNKSFTLS